MTCKTGFLSWMVFTVLIGSLFSCKQNKETTENTIEVVAQSKIETPEKVLRHMVIFKFNDDSGEADVAKLNTAFTQLPEAIPEIVDFEWGLNDSPEDFDQDFTHCYLVTFSSEKDRDSIYAPHPAHQAFVESLQPHLEKVFVVDYWTNP
ncbi:MAG: Dabb family protein [Bacteroidota bacterium]